MPNPIPEGFHTVTPYLMLDNSAAAIDFYKKAFGAEERDRMTSPDGKSIMHAELKIGNSILMLGDDCPQAQGKSPKLAGTTTMGLFLYVADVDAAFARAKNAGATPIMPPTDMFWGDRYCKLSDPFGHQWSIGTHKEDLTKEEIMKRAQAFFASMPKK